MSAVCSSCGAEVVWVKTRTGKKMPVDALATPDGNVVITRLEDSGELRGVVLTVEEMASNAWAGRRHTSHFATCPQADAHRKQRGKP